MINDGMTGAKIILTPFNYVIELQEMCKHNKKYIKYQTI